MNNESNWLLIFEDPDRGFQWFPNESEALFAYESAREQFNCYVYAPLRDYDALRNQLDAECDEVELKQACIQGMENQADMMRTRLKVADNIIASMIDHTVSTDKVLADAMAYTTLATKGRRQ